MATVMLTALSVLFMAGLCCGSGVAEDGDSLSLQVPCNGSSTALNDTGTVQLVSNGSSPYPCQWVLKHGANVSSLFLQLAQTNMADEDYVMLYDGASQKGNFIEMLKGHPASFLVMSFANETTLVMTKQLGKQPLKLNFSYSADVCSVSMRGLTSGVVTSPLYRSTTDPRKFNCTYNVNASSVFPGGKVVDLSFILLALPKGQLKVQTTGGTSKVFTGGQVPPDVFSAEDMVVDMTLTISDTTVQQNFQAIFSPADQVCSRTYLVNSSQTVSVTVPTLSFNLLDCRMVLESAHGVRLRVSVDTPFLNDGLDRIILRDRGSLSGPVIAQMSAEDIQTGEVFLSGGHALWLRVVMDLSIKDLSHSMTLTVSELQNGGRFMEPGQITLEMPISANSSNSSYQLVTENQVQLLFGKSLMYGTASLDVYEGLQEIQDNLIVSFRTDTAFFPVISEGTSLLLVARNFNGRQNFSANFSDFTSDGCYRISHASRGELLTTYSTSSPECRWIISPQTPGVIVLQVSELSLQENTSVTIYRGTKEFGLTLAVWNSSSANTSVFPTITVDASSRAEVVYRSENNCSSNCTGSVVNVQYSLTASYCGPLQSGVAGKVTSPGYPNTYPLNAACQWSMNTTSKLPLAYLTFSSFSLAPFHSLAVTQTQNASVSKVAKLGGSARPADLVVRADKVTLAFSSQAPGQTSWAVAPGFSLSYQLLACGGNLTSVNGSLTTPGYPKSAPPGSQCIWVVNLPGQGPNGSVNIVQFSVSLSGKLSNSRDGVLDVRDGPSAWAPPLSGNWSLGKSGTVLSRHSAIFVRFTAIPGSALALNLSYTAFSCNASQLCGNGLCLHPDWRCNGRDDCGDNTDERNCTAPIPLPQSLDGYVPSFWLAVVALLLFVFGIVVAFLLPAIYRRLKYPNYSALRDLTAPVDA